MSALINYQNRHSVAINIIVRWLMTDTSLVSLNERAKMYIYLVEKKHLYNTYY